MTKYIIINMNKNIYGGMELKYNTKVQSTGGTLSTSIPKTIRDLLDLSKGDSVEWIVNISDSGTKISLEKK